MYNTKEIQEGLPYLVATINNSIYPLFVTEWSVGQGRFHWNRVYLRFSDMDYGSFAFTISDSGDIFDPILNGPILSLTFDWVHRLGYNLDRQIERLGHYKKELLEKVWRPSNLNNLIY